MPSSPRKKKQNRAPGAPPHGRSAARRPLLPHPRRNRARPAPDFAHAQDDEENRVDPLTANIVDKAATRVEPTDAVYIFIFFFKWYGHHRDLHSFPTRRSSDL